jgi:TnpA family transposase
LELKTNKRRELLSGAQRVQLLALPTGLREVEERYSFTPSDLEFIGAQTNSNRLGIAVQLCFLRHPGRTWTPEERIPATMLHWIAAQVNADPDDIKSKRDPTRAFS